MGKRLTAQEIDQVYTMRAQGETWAFIAEFLDRNKGNLHRQFKEGFISRCKYVCKNCGGPTDSERKLCRKADCRKIYNREYQRDNHSWFVYRLRPSDVEVLLEAQGGTCALPFCDVVLTKENTHIDHDHETGIVRGLCCSRHNKGLGFFDDAPAKLRAAAEYLEQRGYNGKVSQD